MKKNLLVSMVALMLTLGCGSVALAANGNAESQGANGLEAAQGVANQAQSQAQNQGDESQAQIQIREEAQASEATIQRMGTVANAVQGMLQLADRTGGVGQQIREIAQNQNQEFEAIEMGLAKAQERSRIAKFFIGPNYGKINDAEQRMEKIQERIQELNELRSQVANQADQSLLQEHIQNLEQVKSQLQSQLNEESRGFSLLGWAFRIFAK